VVSGCTVAGRVTDDMTCVGGCAMGFKRDLVPGEVVRVCTHWNKENPHLCDTVKETQATLCTACGKGQYQDLVCINFVVT
jgi:hypothetical protein